MLLPLTAGLSYGLAAASFCVLGILLITAWSRRRHTAILGVACVATALWGGATALAVFDGATVDVDVLELCRDAAWTAFLLRLLGYPHPGARAVPMLATLAYLALMVGAVFPDGGLAQARSPLLTLVLASRALLAVAGLVLVEQLYRHRSRDERWAIKYACLGTGAIWAYDFYLYTDALLLQAVNAELWAARGLVNALTVPLLAVAVARSAAWPSGMALSRRALFHSAALAGSAGYLLAMGAAGYYLRYVGGAWGGLMQMAFLCGALLLLAGLLVSGTFRARLKVLISKHFYRYDYDYREQWLALTRRLSQHAPGPYQRAVEAMAELVDSPGGALWIMDDGGVPQLAAHCQLEAAAAATATVQDGPDSQNFFAFLGRQRWVIDLTLPAPEGTPPVPPWLAALPHARLLVPLLHQERLFGIVVLQQTRSELHLNWEVLDLIKVAAGQVSSYLALQAAAEALTTARQFESYHRMSTFVVHDLKNLVAQLSLMLPNARLHGHNPAFRADMLETIEHAVQKTTLMLHKLLRSDDPQRNEALDLGQLLARMVALQASAVPRPTLDCLAGPVQVLADPGRLQRVLGHLLQNAIDATPATGTVRVQLLLTADGSAVQVAIADSGHGMSMQFVRERLFKPFDTTKTAGMGIGAFESRAYIAELGGALDVASAHGCGSTFIVTLPMLPALPMLAKAPASEPLVAATRHTPQPLGALLG